LRRYLLTLWNTYSFFVTYANLDGFDLSAPAPAVADRPELDRWVVAELHDTIREVTDALENYDALAGGRRLDTFVDDLSNWYVRRSRRRFWRSGDAGDGGDKAAAHATLHECLVTIAKLTAPFTPFIAEEIFTNLGRAESVHLEDWPPYDEALIDQQLLDRMGLARQLVALGRAARAKAKVKTRQPLPRALAVVPAGAGRRGGTGDRWRRRRDPDAGRHRPGCARREAGGLRGRTRGPVRRRSGRRGHAGTASRGSGA